MEEKISNGAAFANTLCEEDNGINHAMMSDCERFGMTWGCNGDCPVLIRGECEIQEENKHLLEDE